MGVETELKLRWAGAGTPTPQAVAAPDWPAPRRRRLVSVYYDTPEGALWRRGVAWRVRRAGRTWLQTVKWRGEQQAAMAVRREVEVPLAGPEPAPERLPPEARAVVAAVAGRAGPVFETRFERWTWRLAPEPGLEVELALDLGELRAGAAREPIAELEIELLQGPPEGLYRVGRALAARLPLALGHASKAERGYRLAGLAAEAPAPAPWSPPALDREADAAEAGRILTHDLARHLDAHLEAALAGDAEGLHQVRLALRRLRTLPRLLPVAWAEDEALADDLRALARATGPLRDLDVLGEAWGAVAARCPGLPGPGPGFETARAEARAAARAALGGPASARAVLGLMAAGEAARAGPWRRHGARVLERLHRQVRNRGGGFARLGPEDRHRLRIAVKRLRLAAQLVAGPEPRGRARRYLRRLTRLNEALGALQDLAVQRGLAARIGAGAPLCAWLEGRAEGWEAAARLAWRRWREAAPFWD
ncbi:CYTH and CHAD domain-containing protein [Inmirania thermothiophila]|uniref:Adenylate cyclase n=1 Tax=Inmirania thermothiophila TaxID=1750597 RepID=A0A3N1Y9G9_9GAMM|nr:CYTH and CHAD domain-containing protein [Inmirania thermothiophila]ROR34262.1 adenylate cyclase [Inmirania thermothiophila]